jgi:MFS transporter, PPP family, 3-phenylpropionic acid transporter
VTALVSARHVNPGLRLALVYAALFFEMGVQIPFLPVWLGARGLSDNEIAILLGAPLAMRVVATPLLSALADRRRDVPGMLSAATIVLASASAFLGFLHGFTPLLVAVAILLCAQGLAMPLADALAATVIRAFDGRSNERLDYGRIRKWGSAAYVIGNLAGGLYLSFFSISQVVPILTFAALLGVMATFYAAPLAIFAHEERRAPAPAAGGADIGLLPLLIAAAALIQTSHALVNTFGSIHWEREGHSTAFVGAAWAVGVICETSFFALAGRWFSGPDRAFALLALGGATATARWLVMAANPGPSLLLVAQASHGLSFASTHLGSMFFIFAGAPSHMRARAQGWLQATIAGLSAILIAVSGPLYAHFGEIAYVAMAGLSAVGLALAFALRGRQKRA